MLIPRMIWTFRFFRLRVKTKQAHGAEWRLSYRSSTGTPPRVTNNVFSPSQNLLDRQKFHRHSTPEEAALLFQTGGHLFFPRTDEDILLDKKRDHNPTCIIFIILNSRQKGAS